ncbi:GNAT family N-acetyltransferase [Pyruvatibacter sp.]
MTQQVTTLEIHIVRTLEDLHRAYAVRDIVFIDHQSCPYTEEYDGNDLCATHLLASIGSSPIGTIRIRYFAGFAKLERLAVLPRHRGGSVATQLVETALSLIRQKGYRRFRLHAQTRYERFWSRWANRDAGCPHFRFSDHDYVAMSGRLASSASHRAAYADPMILNRPEGEWDHPGVLDHSQGRMTPVTETVSGVVQ